MPLHSSGTANSRYSSSDRGAGRLRRGHGYVRNNPRAGVSQRASIGFCVQEVDLRSISGRVGCAEDSHELALAGFRHKATGQNVLTQTPE